MNQKEWETSIGHDTPKFRCDRCRSAFAPLIAWPTHPRQGYAMCIYCGDVVTKYVRDEAGNWVKP